MISEALVERCMAYDRAEYNENKTYGQVYDELQNLESAGCLVENILHCQACPNFGTKDCPLK